MIGKEKVSTETVAQLLEEYGKPLFKWPDPGGKYDVVFRAISRAIWNEMVREIESAESEGRAKPIEKINDMIIQNCVVWPEFNKEDLDSLPVGVVPSIIKSVQEKSGFVDVDIWGNIIGPDLHTTVIKDFDYWGDLNDVELQELTKDCFWQICKVRVGRFVFVIRPMTRMDMQVSEQSLGDKTVTLLKCVTMWPQNVNWDILPAGTVEMLGRAASEISGWDTETQVEELT